MNNTVERVWIGLGSNISNPKKQADMAVQALSKLPMTKLITFSSYYCSQPLGQKNQPRFLNAIIILDTQLTPQVLLSYLQYIEISQGRVRINNTPCWQSRTLDLDILLFGRYTICTPELTVPHYDMFNREFVIYPLFELDRYLVFPNGRIIADIVKDISKNGLSFWRDRQL